MIDVLILWLWLLHAVVGVTMIVIVAYRWDKILAIIHDRYHERWQAMGQLDGFEIRFPGGRYWTLSSRHAIVHYGFLYFPRSLFMQIPEWVLADPELYALARGMRWRSAVAVLLMLVWTFGWPLLAVFLS